MKEFTYPSDLTSSLKGQISDGEFLRRYQIFKLAFCLWTFYSMASTMMSKGSVRSNLAFSGCKCTVNPANFISSQPQRNWLRED